MRGPFALMLMTGLLVQESHGAAVIGTARVVSTDLKAVASCRIIKRRFQMTSIRAGEGFDYIDRATRAVRSDREFRRLNYWSQTSRSKLPGQTANTEIIVASWDLASVSEGDREELNNSFDRLEKTVSVANLAWTTHEGFLPTDLQLAVQGDRLTLRFQTNLVDRCLGNQEVRIEIALPERENLILVSRLSEADHFDR